MIRGSFTKPRRIDAKRRHPPKKMRCEIYLGRGLGEVEIAAVYYPAARDMRGQSICLSEEQAKKLLKELSEILK